MCRCTPPGSGCSLAAALPPAPTLPLLSSEPPRRLFYLNRRRTVKAFYQGSIRSGFVAHSDEDDPEVLQRIHAQALKDAEWLVAKVRPAFERRLGAVGGGLGLVLDSLRWIPAKHVGSIVPPAHMQYEKEAAQERAKKAQQRK